MDAVENNDALSVHLCIFLIKCPAHVSGKGNFLSCVDKADLCIYGFMLFRNRRQHQIVSKPTSS